MLLWFTTAPFLVAITPGNLKRTSFFHSLLPTNCKQSFKFFLFLFSSTIQISFLNLYYRCRDWCRILGLNSSDLVHVRSSKSVCCLHFQPFDILPTGKLTKTAVPGVVNIVRHPPVLQTVTNIVAQLPPSQLPSVICKHTTYVQFKSNFSAG